MALSKNEAAYIVGFLNELDDQFSNDGCNDMYLKDTPENRQMYLEAEKLWVGENCDDEEEGTSLEDALQVPYGSRSKEQKIGTNNQTILNYLRKRLKEEFKLTDKEVPDTANW
jgi:hypothetical protein